MSKQETVEERIARERPGMAELVRRIEAVREQAAQVAAEVPPDESGYQPPVRVQGHYDGQVSIALHRQAGWLLELGAVRSEWYANGQQRDVDLAVADGVVLRSYEHPDGEGAK